VEAVRASRADRLCRNSEARITPGITLRPVRDDDEPFLLALYATVRAPELEQVAWTDEQKAVFVRHQFDAQSTHWRENYHDTSFDVIERAGVPIGRLYVARWRDEIRVVDVALMPEHRGSGVGGALFRSLFEESDRTGRPVTIHVEIYNPARRLYERLGFVLKEEKGIYLLMERAPSAPQANTAS
jgi:ribosomal protein S18 acetylase RimI-like enzyme